MRAHMYARVTDKLFDRFWWVCPGVEVTFSTVKVTFSWLKVTFRKVPMAGTNPMVVVSWRKRYDRQGNWNLGLVK